MSKITVGAGSSASMKNNKKTSQGNGNVKMSSMNKSKKRGHKKYRGQGK